MAAKPSMMSYYHSTKPRSSVTAAPAAPAHSLLASDGSVITTEIFEQVVVKFLYGVDEALGGSVHTCNAAQAREIGGVDATFTKETSMGRGVKNLTYGEVRPSSMTAHVLPAMALLPPPSGTTNSPTAAGGEPTVQDVPATKLGAGEYAHSPMYAAGTASPRFGGVNAPELVADAVFYDLGSGTGKIPLQVALMCPTVKRAVGIELAKNRHDIAEAVFTRIEKSPLPLLSGELAAFMCALYGMKDSPALRLFVHNVVTRLKEGVKRVAAINASFLSYDYTDATSVFVNNTVFEPDLMANLSVQLANLPNLRHLTLLRKLCHRHGKMCCAKEQPCTAFAHPPATGICWPTWDYETTLFTYQPRPAHIPPAYYVELERMSPARSVTSDASLGTPTRTTPSRKPSSGTPGSGSSRRSVKQSVASPPRPLPELPTDARGGILLQPNEGGVTSEEGTTGLGTHMPPRPRRAVGAYQSLLIRADSAGSMSGAPGPASLTPTATNEGGYTPSASAATSMVGKPPLARVPSRPRRGTSHSLSSLDASDTESELASLPSAHAPSHALSTSSTSQRVAATLGAGAVQQEELYARVSTPTDQLIVAASSAPGGTGGRGGGSVGGRTPATPGTPVRPPSGRRASKTVTPSGSATAALQELMAGDAGEVLAEYTDAGVIKSHSVLSGASPARRTALPPPRAAALFRDLPGGTDDVELGTGGDVSTVAPVRSLASVAAIGASPARSAVLLAPSTGSSAVARRSRATSRGRINSVSSDADSDGTVEAIPPTRISAGRSPKHPGLLSASRGGSASEDEEGGMLLPRTAPSTQPLGASPAAPPAAEKRPTRRVGPARMVAPPAL